MNAKVLLCADEESARHPELIGLREENLLEQPWLAVRTTAREARDLAAKSASIEEIWVVSCPDIEPINLAAAVKRAARLRSSAVQWCVRCRSTALCRMFLTSLFAAVRLAS